MQGSAVACQPRVSLSKVVILHITLNSAGCLHLFLQTFHLFRFFLLHKAGLNLMLMRVRGPAAEPWLKVNIFVIQENVLLP